MTAHCHPDPYPDPTDIRKAGEFVALAIDPAVPYTEAIRKIAAEWGELRKRAEEATS